MHNFLSKCELLEVGFGSIGINVLISKNANIYNPQSIHLGSNIRIDDFCIISAGIERITIKDYVHIGCYSSLIGKGRIVLEKYVNISSRVSIYSTSDDFSGNTLTNPMIPDKYKKLDIRPVTLEKHVIIGTNSTISWGYYKRRLCGRCILLVKSSVQGINTYRIPAKEIGLRSSKFFKL